MSDIFNIVNRVKGVRTFKGIDNKGFESVVFIFKEKPNFELKTTKIASRIIERNDEYRLFISLFDNNKDTSEIFDVLSEDLIKSVEVVTDEKEVQEILASRFQYWSDLFKRKREQMDEKWVQGFVGELWYLDNVLSNKIGIDDAIKSWTGPIKANQDFITQNKIFEIKTRTQQTNSIKISNNNQLSEDMYLVVIEISKSSEVAESSWNLTKLIESIQKKIISPETHRIFNEKLLELSLFPSSEACIYDKFSYHIQSLSYFEVNSKFPFIDHMSVPSAVIKYSYELSLPIMNDFLIEEEYLWS